MQESWSTCEFSISTSLHYFLYLEIKFLPDLGLLPWRLRIQYCGEALKSVCLSVCLSSLLNPVCVPWSLLLWPHYLASECLENPVLTAILTPAPHSPFQCWGYKCMLSHLAIIGELGRSELRSSCLHNRHFTRYLLSPCMHICLCLYTCICIFWRQCLIAQSGLKLRPLFP